jgi:two-component system phosphate regulon sensor histidine kinase PhoR
MKTLSLRARMVVTALGAAAIGLGVVLALAGPALDRRARDDVFATLAAESRLMARVVEDQLSRSEDTEALDAVVDAAAPEVQARVTVIARDGRVLADSSLSGVELAAVASHADRPEVKDALLGHVGRAQRTSATIGEDLLYAAVPVRRHAEIVAVVRLSRDLAVVEQQSRELLRAAASGLAWAVLATGILSLVLSVSLGRSLKEMMKTAGQFARGNLSARIPVRREDELGELARIINNSADQLQERVAEIARDRGRTEAILLAMEDGVLAVDHRGVVVLANPSLMRALGLADPVGRHYTEVIRHPGVGDVITAVGGGAERKQVEVAPVGHARVFTVTGVPFPGELGKPHGVVLTLADTTEQRRVEQVRRDFVANASHELRTPLTSIRGYVEALEDGAVDDAETAQLFLEKIRTHAERMSTLVADLLELGRLESGVRVPAWRRTSPSAVTDEVVASFAGLAAWKHVTLARTDLAPPDVVTDPDWLLRLIENLVDNAIKYTPSGGRVEVVARPAAEGAALIEVVDNGPGIASEHLPRIFERFYRVDKSRSRDVGGTGLGLSIVKHLADSIGVTVAVESTPGQGTSFAVTIPREPAKAPSAAVADQA